MAKKVIKVIKLADTRVTVVLRGLARVRVLEITTRLPFLQARVQHVPDVISDPVEVEGLTKGALKG